MWGSKWAKGSAARRTGPGVNIIGLKDILDRASESASLDPQIVDE